MCGITGFVNKNINNLADIELLKKMTDAIAHRGPDAEGKWVKDNLALGHRRLSIIDLDDRSSQPFFSNDNKYVITYNGEIYNYIELKKELLKLGAKFRTTSDTEVILEAYRYYGAECFSKFNGMWSLCIYDIDKNILVFSRDRFGIKPLYYLDNERVYAFSSEIKGIISAFPEENKPDYLMLYRYLSGALNENQDERTYYKNIKIFPAASYLIYNLSDNSKKVYNYWNVDEEKFYNKWIRGKNPLKVFKSIFDNAVEIRLRSDVEVGACLSGGLDSSASVGCVSRKFNKRIHTFSSIYNDKECNEKEYIDSVNESNSTIPHYISPDDEEKSFSSIIEKINYYHDGPAWSASLYSQYMVMKGVSKHVKVVLDGQGADEMFAGYIPYYSHYILDLLDKGDIISRLKAIILLTIVNEEWPNVVGAISTDTVVELVGIENSFMFRSCNEKNEEIRRNAILFTEEFSNKINETFLSKEVQLSSRLNTRLCNDILFKSIPALLHNEDSNSMAFSIESRVPFLDYRMVEFSIALDGKYKIRNQWTKWIIRKSLKGYLPKKVAKRKNKMGFPAPFSRWLKSGESKNDLKEIIFSFGKRNIVPSETIKYYYNCHINGEGDLSDILFKFYSAELWLRTCD